LHERVDHSLAGMPVLAVFAMIMSSLLPIFVALLHRRVRLRDTPQNAALLARVPVSAK
jgi:hypothetical protein